jgi:type I restriction enzyme R subunit
MVGENKTHLTETDIFTKYLLPAVKTAGWDVMSQVRQEVKLRDGKIVVRGKLASRMGEMQWQHYFSNESA